MTHSDKYSVALQYDAQDPLKKWRDAFYIPQHQGQDEIYFCGNSLGLQPKSTESYLTQELAKWQHLAVKGHFEQPHPWLSYHESLTETMAHIAGALPHEVIVMNTLTVNLHLMMVSFYHPTPKRYKILLEDHAFPSDHYAVESQLKYHGFDPEEGMLLLKPRDGEECLRSEDILSLLKQHGEEIALVLLPGVQYYTGQVLPMEMITQAAHDKGIMVGFDLAHAAGNIVLDLHRWDVDFACWCNYKYLNSGPGSIGSCFIHERHGLNNQTPRFAGWWGHDQNNRFKMENHFRAIPGAYGWQLSNPPILSLAAIRASLDIIKQAGGMPVLREKSLKLTQYLQQLLAEELAHKVTIITPEDQHSRGCQLSLQINHLKQSGHEVFKALTQAGVTGDWREPNVIRVAPTPLYNTFTEVRKFVDILTELL